MAIPDAARRMPGPGTVVGTVVGGIVVFAAVGIGDEGLGVVTVVAGGDVVVGTVVTGTVVGTADITGVVPVPMDIEGEGDRDEVISGLTLWRSIAF